MSVKFPREMTWVDPIVHMGTQLYFENQRRLSGLSVCCQGHISLIHMHMVDYEYI